jgi:hypothetical protein
VAQGVTGRLTLNLLTTTIVAPPSNVSKWQMGLNSVFKGLMPQIFLTFGTTRVVGHQPYAPAAFTPGEIPVTPFLEAESTQGHMVQSVATEKIPSDTTGNRSPDFPTSNAVP